MRPPTLARPDLFRQSAWIAGAWRDGADRIEVDNPATGQIIGSVPNLGADAATAAVKAAHAAGPDWRAHSARERASILKRWFDLILLHRENLALILTSEQGKPLAEARGEIAYAAAFVEWFAEEARRTYGDIIPGFARGVSVRVEKRPVGVVAAVTPWNFPAAMVTRKLAPALAAGCTAVLKPSELTPFTALALAALAEEAGVPTGVLNVVTGTPAPIGEVFVTDPRVAKFTFTGSTAVGRKLGGQAMAAVKRVSLELGGNAPFIVLDDADLDAAVEGAVVSKFRNAGQTCVCANRFFIQSGIYDAFAERLAERVGQLVVGDGRTPGVQIGPLINQAAVEKVRAHVEDARAGGGRVLVGGEADGSFFQPTVIADVASDALLCREETFGPVAGLIRFEDAETALRFANDSPAGLAAYVYTRDLARSGQMVAGLETGMVGLNTGVISSETAPFGGCRLSGVGREGSRYGIDEYLELKTVVQVG